MNETDWLTCEDPDRMLKFLGKKYSPRKLRLFAVACCRKVWHLFGDASRRAVEVAEAFADGRASERDLDEAGDALAASEAPTDPNEDSPAVWATWRNAMKAAEGAAAWTAGWAVDARERTGSWESLFGDERGGQVHLLRDIAGNPFKRAAVAPQVLSWQEGTVVRMAQAIYEDRRFGEIPVLADALEDAGCDNADILNHCRGGGEHVRGCWVIDLLTGRT
jgi:hypothetical protein